MEGIGLKINSVTLVMSIAFVALVIPACSGPALAYDPRVVVPGATITGVIRDANGNAMPNATVRLFSDGQLFDAPRNPQQSSNGSGPYASIGRYQFMRLPYGEFVVEAEVSDASGLVHRSNLTVNVAADTVTADIVISDLVIGVPVTPVPPTASLPTPTPGPSREPCGLGLLLPVLGASVLMVRKRKRD